MDSNASKYRTKCQVLAQKSYKCLEDSKGNKDKCQGQSLLFHIDPFAHLSVPLVDDQMPSMPTRTVESMNIERLSKRDDEELQVDSRQDVMDAVFGVLLNQPSFVEQVVMVKLTKLPLSQHPPR